MIECCEYNFPHKWHTTYCGLPTELVARFLSAGDFARSLEGVESVEDFLKSCNDFVLSSCLLLGLGDGDVVCLRLLVDDRKLRRGVADVLRAGVDFLFETSEVEEYELRSVDAK